MIDEAHVRVAALSSATEDYTGFYELIWELNGKYPDASDVERSAVARSVLAALVTEGLVEVFRATWGSQEYVVISQPRGVAAVANPACWRSPAEVPGGVFYAFAATDAGEREYTKLSPDDFKKA